jgi:hypothetical protein
MPTPASLGEVTRAPERAFPSGRLQGPKLPPSGGGVTAADVETQPSEGGVATAERGLPRPGA